MLNVYEQLNLVPFSIFMIFKKATFGHHFRVEGRQGSSNKKASWRRDRDPAFRETKVITVPLGPSV